MSTEGFFETRVEGLNLAVLVQAARHVAWHYSLTPHCYPPGDTYKTILQMMAMADMATFSRLRTAFPVHALLMSAVIHADYDQIDVIRHLAEYGKPPEELEQA